MALRILLFACLGVAMEVVWTAILDFPKRKSWRLMGQSYIWMLPIYGSIPVFFGFLYPRLSGLPLAARLAVYVVLLMTAEYASGWAIRQAAGECPWEAEYRGKRWAVHALVRLDYAPAWALACFIFERVYLALLPL